MDSKSATIYDVAAAAGVAIKTVSRVVNGESGVSEATRQRVREAVMQLNYRPNREARSLASAQSFLFALIFSEAQADMVLEAEDGIVERCGDERHLIIEAVGDDQDAMVEAVDRLLSTSRPDAVLLLPPVTESRAVIARLTDSGVPFACLSAHPAVAGEHRLQIDDRSSAQALTAHLIELGHCRIGFIRQSEEQVEGDLRLRGYRDALSAAGITYDPALVEDGNGTFASGMHAASLLLSSPEPPTAIFASCDEMALGVLSTAGRVGISVPGSLSVCGFGNSQLARIVWPSLTTIGQPIASMAYDVTDALLDKRDNRFEKLRQVRYAPELTVGGTTAAPDPA